MCRLRSTTNASPRSWPADPGARRPRTPARPPYSWRDGWLADSCMNPTQTPPRSPDADEATGHDGPLDSLLTQIINGFFVLTDGQGAVSKGGEPAGLLFGLDAVETLGKGLFRDARRLRARGGRGVAALPRERRGAGARASDGERDLQ